MNATPRSGGSASPQLGTPRSARAAVEPGEIFVISFLCAGDIELAETSLSQMGAMVEIIEISFFLGSRPEIKWISCRRVGARPRGDEECVELYLFSMTTFVSRTQGSARCAVLSAPPRQRRRRGAGSFVVGYTRLPFLSSSMPLGLPTSFLRFSLMPRLAGSWRYQQSPPRSQPSSFSHLWQSFVRTLSPGSAAGLTRFAATSGCGGRIGAPHVSTVVSGQKWHSSVACAAL